MYFQVVELVLFYVCRPEFSATASPRPKDVVIVIASTQSMKAPSGVPNKQKLTVAKEAAHAVINTLNPNDRVRLLFTVYCVKAHCLTIALQNCMRSKLALDFKKHRFNMG